MRNAFAAEALNIAKNDKTMVLLSADIGNRLFDTFKTGFSDRFINCGVAEANMTGMAAGLAMSGLRPVTYTIAAFNTVRCLEQIRVDICYHNLPVTIVGVGAGLSYANLGYTHHAAEDIGFLRMLPNMTILCPADPLEVRGALRAAHEHEGPTYIRLGKKGEPEIHSEIPKMEVGESLVVMEGDDVCLLATGTILEKALDAANILEKQGISACVISFYSAKPLDSGKLGEVFSRFPLVATIEEHSEIGGIGAAVAEWAVRHRVDPVKFLPISLPDRIIHESGSQEFAREYFGLTAPVIANRLVDRLINK